MSTKTLIKVVALSFAVLVIMEQITYWFELQLPFGINPTSSIPIGIYRRTHEALRRGVVIQFPEPHKAGVPIIHPYGIPNLLKYIAAMPGDIVDVTNQGVWINGHLWPNSSPGPPPFTPTSDITSSIPATYGRWAQTITVLIPGTSVKSLLAASLVLCDHAHFSASPRTNCVQSRRPIPHHRRAICETNSEQYFCLQIVNKS